MENPEEILHSLEEFAKLKPKDIPRELEEYLCFVAKTGDPVYQWSAVKSLFREKLIGVITEFYESCPSVEIPPCPNVDMFNYDSMKNFILEKLDTFAAAPFTVQRICELLTTPRKEYNRIDKYMRALEKNILVVSTTEPGNRRNAENGEGIMNGIESEHIAEGNSNNDINVEEMDDTPVWPRVSQPETNSYQNSENNITIETQTTSPRETVQESFLSEPRPTEEAGTSSAESVITCRATEQPYVSIEPVAAETCTCPEEMVDNNVSVTITAIPAPVQKRRDSIEPIVTADDNTCDTVEVSTENKVNSKESETEKPDTETQQTVAESTDTSALEIVEHKDGSLQLESQTSEINTTDKPELPCEKCNDSDALVSGKSDGERTEKQEELEPISPVVVEQETEILAENTGDATPSGATTENTSDCEHTTKVTSTAYSESQIEETATVVSNESDMTRETASVTAEPLVPETNETIVSSSVCIADTTVDSNAETEAASSTSELKNCSLESPLVDYASDVVQKAETTSIGDTTDNKTEETPMEVDLDGENSIDTASTAPNSDSDNV